MWTWTQEYGAYLKKEKNEVCEEAES